MSEDETRQRQLNELRQQAEKVVSQRPEDFHKMPVLEIQNLIRGMAVRQLELEMRNEELVRMKIELEESRKLYIDLFNFAPVGYFNLDGQGTIIDTNITASDMLNVPRANLPNVRFINFVQPQHQVTFDMHLKQISHSGRRQSCELEMERKDGTSFYAQLQTVPVFDGKRVIYRVSIADVTERKRAEEQLRLYALMLQNTAEAVFSTDQELKIRTWNKAAETLYGWQADEVIGKELYDVLDIEYLRNAREQALKQVFEQGYWGEVVHKRQDGTSLDVSVTRSVLKDDDGNEQGLVMIVHDITERKRIEHDLQERIKELQCLYGISQVLEKPGLTLDEIYQEIVSLLPPAWQYPEITSARIIFGKKEFRAPNFKETIWKMSSNVKVYGIKEGSVEVFYQEEKPLIDEGPFLKEERLLLDTIAERSGKVAERLQAEEAAAKIGR